MTIQRITCVVLLLGMWCAAQPLQGADQASINSAIKRGRAYLIAHIKDYKGGRKSLAAYALLKTGSKKTDPEIKLALDAALQEAEQYAAGSDPPGIDRNYQHIEFAYTASSHLFLFEAADPEAFKPQLTSMATFLCEQQLPNGSWCYVNIPVSDAGDTSQVQFVLLGLWAALRAKVEVPNQVFQNAAQWLLKTQLSNGSFAYQPVSGENADQRGFRYSTTVGGVASLLLVRYLFFPKTREVKDPEEAAAKAQKKFGVLDRLQDDVEKSRKKESFSLSLAALDKAISQGMKVVEEKFATSPPSPLNCHMYLLYTMERASALLDSDKLAGHDWYSEASDSIVRAQLADGSWSDYTGDCPATSFAILCLSKTTAKIVSSGPVKKVGGGLLSGARGLPGDLSKLQMKDGQAVERKSQGAVDDLLAELEKAPNATVEEVQQAVLESVNLDDPEQLVGAIDRLKRLAVDPRPEVRRTAVWAIGRTGDVRMAPLLIAALADGDVEVVRDASHSLAILSRKSIGLVNNQGKVISIEPLEGLEEGAPQDQIDETLQKWQAAAIPSWKSWYLSVRPYDERDDRQQLQKKR